MHFQMKLDNFLLMRTKTPQLRDSILWYFGKLESDRQAAQVGGRFLIVSEFEVPALVSGATVTTPGGSTWRCSVLTASLVASGYSEHI